jgi:hypothetical protein
LTRQTKALIEDHPSRREGTPEGRAYRAFHEERYQFLLETVAGLVPEARRRILIVGPSFETAMMRERFPDAIVDTLGISDAGFSPSAGEVHVVFDLNEAHDSASWPSLEPYDIVVAAEVVEHLYLPPSIVFPFFASCLSASGRLVVQTPNAVALSKRLMMLIGRHPYMQLLPPRPDPGHVREYTFPELKEAGAAAGLRVERYWARNYFGYAGVAGRIYNHVCDVLPHGLRNGITVLFARVASSSAATR